MGYVGVKPSAVPLTSADITDGIITSAKIADGTIVNADINASAAIASTKLSGTGKVLQVVSTTSNSAQSVNSQSFTELTSLTTSITPSSASSKILIFGNINFTSDTNEALTVVHFRLRRDSTDICQGTGATGNQLNASVSALDNDNDAVCGTAPFSFLDSPNTTSAISYKIMGANWTGASGFKINQPVSPGNDFYAGFVTSTLTLMEIAG
jgi:hypothetical protein